MKKIYYFALLTLFNVFALSIMAQQSVTIQSDSSYKTECPIPAFLSMNPFGIASNYNSATDSVLIEFFWGDGTSSLDTAYLNEAGVDDFWDAHATHNYTLPGVYHVMMVATMPNNVADTSYWNDSVNAAPGCNLFSGKVYWDQNANCTYDSGTDSVLSANIIVTDANGAVVEYAWADQNGDYSFSLPNNLPNLSITATRYPNWAAQCPASGAYTINSNASQSFSFDFGIECTSANLDKYTYINTQVAASGDTGWVWFGAYAQHCGITGIIQDTVIVTLDSNVSYVGMSSWYNTPPPSVVNGNQLIWYTDWTHNGYSSSHILNGMIYIETDTGLTLQDTACFSVDFASTPSGDINPLNNQSAICEAIGLPYDPNNKLAFPQGEGPLGKIDTSVQRLTYVVNFQNTGSASAEDVYVLDTIPAELDFESILVLETSHPMKMIHQQNNRIRFDFPNINLPDSASDEEGSKGYVVFSIHRDPNLPVETEIKNRVGIYFDYQPAVVTEYAINTLYIAPEVIDSLMIEAQVDAITCLNNDNGAVRVTILEGNPPYSYAWSNGATTHEIVELSAGLYTITVNDAAGQIKSASVEVEEARTHPSPIVGEFTGDRNVESWQAYTYSIEASPASTYEWNVIGGELLDQANNQAEVLWHGGPEGQLRVVETDLNGCTGNDSLSVPIQFLSVEELDGETVRVYPNPASDEVQIRISDQHIGAQIRLYDMQGKLVKQEVANSSSQHVSLSSIPDGMYWLNVSNNEKTANVKLIIMP